MEIVYSKIKNILKDKRAIWLLILINFTLFTLLLFKNPFSERNLIPNLEPYPDVIHYITPALTLIKGQGLYIEREGRYFKSTVPFLYSLTLTPLFVLYPDPRMFYFGNLLIAYSAFGFFYIFLIRISSNKFIPHLIAYFYVTNYFIYWYPNLAMAENLGLLIFAAAILLLKSKITFRSIVVASLISVCFYATKYANFTLSMVFVLAYLIKIINSQGKILNLTRDPFKVLKQTYPFLTTVMSCWLIYFLIEIVIGGNGIFLKIKYLMEPLISTSGNLTEKAISNPWFSYTYFGSNFPLYMQALFGNSMRFLWDFTPILPKYLAILSWTGLLAGFFIQQYRLVSFYLTLFILIPVLFLSTFYAADARYIYHVILALLAGLSIFLSLTFNFLVEKRQIKLFYLGLILIFIFYSYQNAFRLKYQIALNLRHAETPWNYLSVKTANNYFKEIEDTKLEKPILISSLLPYYVDYFSEDRYKLLPLSRDQQFSDRREIVWGLEDYSDFIKIYSKYLSQGRQVFVSNAGLGNYPFMHRDFNLIKDNFTLTKVKEGCIDTCNIYQLGFKK